jgi:pimeloyl-ACP methyl ester carboxylesterase
MSKNSMQPKTVKADGAELYCEVRGQGPALLMIGGAGGDAGYYGVVGDLLADAFTVITYDRRANSRSTGRNGVFSIAQQANDAKAVIDALAGGKAMVFGNSGGAIIGLDLAARHPQEVNGLIAHEPPIVLTLPEGDPYRGFFGEIIACFKEQGAQAAGGKFVQTVKGEGGYAWPEGVMERAMGNFEYMFQSEFEGFGKFVPDFERLSTASFPIVLAAGSRDRGLYYARPSQIIAERLKRPWAELPGHHLAFMEEPVAFAGALRALATQLTVQTQGIPARWRSE